MDIVYTLLAYSKLESVHLINNFSQYIKTFQIDIQDGIFTINKTITIEELQNSTLKWNTDRIKKCSFDFHLQVIDYMHNVKIIDELKNRINIDNILIHYSVKPNIERLNADFPHYSFGLVLNPDDKIEEVTKKYNIKKMKSIQLMTIFPGPQGQAFMPEVLQTIGKVRSIGYAGKIMLDGGINDKTIPIILSQHHKPDVLCIGSYFTNAPNFQNRLHTTMETVKKHSSNE